MKEVDIAIVGAGTAGMTAAIYAKRSGLEIAVFEEYMPGGQIVNTGEIENYPALGKIGGFDYSMALLKQVEALGVKLIRKSVSKAERKEGGFSIAAGNDEYFAKALIIATGAKNRSLGAKGEKEFTGRGVSYCATCDGAFYRGKKVAVVGGGNTAAADALELSRMCEKVYLIHRRGEFRAQAADIAKLREKPNVEFVLNSVVDEVGGEDALSYAVVRNVEDGSVTWLDVDGVFVAVGQTPTTALFGGLVKLDEGGYVVAGEDCVAADGIFVAGDCRTKKVRQLVTAAADGAVAALAAAEYVAGKG